MNYRNPELQDRLAAEYVLGTLHGGARRRFQALLREDLALRDRVAFWERELTPMAAPLNGPAPSAQVWQAIERRVAPASAQGSSARAGVDSSASRGGFGAWLSRWFTLPSLGSAVAGLFLGVALSFTAPAWLGRGGGADDTQLPESYVGVLATPQGRTGLIISSLRQGRVLDVKQVQPTPVPAGQTLYLWAIEADGRARGIGPVPAGKFVQVALPDTSEKLFASAVELALSVEPVGSTPAQPGGAYVYRGLCGKLWRVKAP